VLGSDHPDTAATLDNLAGLYRETGQYAKAELLYQRALEQYAEGMSHRSPHFWAGELLGGKGRRVATMLEPATRIGSGDGQDRLGDGINQRLV